MTERSDRPTEKLLDSMQELMERAEEQGYLTIDDLLELFPQAEKDLPDVEDAMAYLYERGIEIIMPDEQLFARVSTRATEPEKDEAEEPVDLSGIDSHDTISLYFKQMASVALLTREEELHLAKQIERGESARKQLEESSLCPETRARCLRDVEMGRQARAHMIKANTRLVVSIAKRYTGLGVPFLDLIQEGNLGLMKGVDRFDYRRGCKLSTYATWWIRQSITRALSRQSRVIRLPSHIGYRIRKMYKTAQQLEQRIGKRPTCEEIAARLGVSPVRVRWLIKVSRRPLSLQKPVGEEEDSELGHFLEDEDSPAPVDGATEALMAEDVERVLSTLTPRQARILCLRFGLRGEHPHTLKEVATKFGLTPERIRQIERKALRRLRHPSRSRHLRPYLR
jgi:RNA polymerase primary sigma factor